MARAPINGALLTYQQAGEGPDVVLIHGLAASRAFWEYRLVATLAERFRVTTFDLRGHGYSATPPSGYTVADLSGDLTGLLDHLGIGRADLVGHSFGGTVALRFAVDHPDRVRSLVVADSRVRSLQPAQALTRSPGWPALRRSFARCGLPVDDDDPEVGVALLRGMAAASAGGDRLRLGESARFVPFGTSARAARQWLRLLDTTTAGIDFRAGDSIDPASLERLSLPVLAVYGERSPNLPSGLGIAGKIPGARLVVSDGAGHFHPVSRPDVFRDCVAAFLGSTAGTRAGRAVTSSETLP